MFIILKLLFLATKDTIFLATAKTTVTDTVMIMDMAEAMPVVELSVLSKTRNI